MNVRTALISISAITLLSTIYYLNTASPNPTMATPSTPQNDPTLTITLSQISRAPPSLLVTLKNNHPTTPFTVLKWSTPLDPQAANLGLFTLVDEDSGEEIPTPGLKVSRLMPPGKEDMVTVAPGTEESHEVVMNKPWLPEKRPARYRVTIEGKFLGLWDRYGAEVEAGELERYTESPFSGRSFKSNEVVMRVE